MIEGLGAVAEDDGSATLNADAMFNRTFFTLRRLLRRETPREAPHSWSYEESHWHGSSFDLARGLEVIEHRGRPPAFVDTMPILRAPEA